MFTFSQIDNSISSQSLISDKKIQNNNEKTINEHFLNNNEKSELQFKCENNHKFSDLILGFMKQNKKILLIYFVFLILIPLKGVLIPHFMSKMYNNVQQKKSIHIYLYIVLILVVLLQIGWLLSEFIDMKLQPLIQKYLMDKIIHHVFKINKENFNEQSVDVIISKIGKFPVTCYNFISQLKSTVLPSCFALIVISIYLVFVDYVIGISFMILLLGIGYFVKRSLAHCDKISYACDQQTTQMYSNVDDTVKNMATVLNFDKTQEEIDYMSELFEKQRNICTKTFNCTLITKYIVIPPVIIFVIFCLTRFYNKLAKGTIHSGIFMNMVVITFLIMNTVFTLTAVFKDMIVRGGIIKSSMHIFDECKIIPHYIDDDADFEKGIQFKKVNFSRFPNQEEKRIFTDLNVHIPKNKTTLIMGKIGSGKTTLINLISKNQTILYGNIYIDGIPIKEINDIKKKVFLIPQTPILFNRSIYDNIIYGLPEKIEPKRIENLMLKLNLGSFLESLPQGLDSYVGFLGSNLSGGQRQMIWIIKLFFLDPEYVIMDEPTSAIDENSRELVYDLLKEIIEKRTVIMITHDNNLQKYANNIIRMEDGKIQSIEEIKK